MTALTTCIWIGFKVSYAPLRGSRACRPPANHCPVPYRSLTLWSTLEFSLDRPDSEGGVLQRVAKLFVYKNLKRGGVGGGGSQVMD